MPPGSSSPRTGSPKQARRTRSAVLGNQPSLNETLNALDWENTPVAAATSETVRGRIETRTIRVLPAPARTGFEDAAQALLIERYVTYKKKGQWHNLAITLFRIHGVTSYTAETRRIAQDACRALQFLDLTGLSPG